MSEQVYYLDIQDRKELKRLVRDISDGNLGFLLEQAKKEKEHRQQINLARYRGEIEHLWDELVNRVRELEKINVSVTLDLETDDSSYYINFTDTVTQENFSTQWHTGTIHRSED